jgi:uncharacterized membrane protein YdjX (TVP38/TMEM64 family)
MHPFDREHIMAKRREWITLGIVAAVLLVAVWLVHQHGDDIKTFIDQHPVSGVILYLVLNIIDAVAAPGATLPLIPVAARTWGHIGAALLTTAGWTAGSLIAFLIARRWGAPVVRKLTSWERVQRLKASIPKNLFWSVVVMRAVLPMDVISYALGLFTDMSLSSYAAATALGLTPSAFVLAYLGRTPHAYTVITILIGFGALAAIIASTRRRGAGKPSWRSPRRSSGGPLRSATRSHR